MDDTPTDDDSPADHQHPLELARSYLLHHGLHDALGARASIHLELECRGPLTTAELDASPLLADTSRSRIYDLLREMRSAGVVDRKYDSSPNAPPRYSLTEAHCGFSQSTEGLSD